MSIRKLERLNCLLFHVKKQAKANLQEVQELQEEKLVLNQTKSKIVLEKTHQKSFKRASKHQAKYGNADDINYKNKQEMSALISTHQGKVGYLIAIELSKTMSFSPLLSLSEIRFC